MSERILVGYWDCCSCGTKKIRGTEENCPNCGAPKGNTKCYLDTEHKEYLDKETSKNYGKGANWICPYCGNQNRYYSTHCRGCGGPKTESVEDYFGDNPNSTTSQKEIYQEDTLSHYDRSSVLDREDPRKEETRFSETSKSKIGFKEKMFNFVSNNKKPIFIGSSAIMALVALVFLLIALFTPHIYNATVTANSWERSISIEEYKTVKEDAWSVPSGGRVYKSLEEIHHYDSVLDHYETVTVTKSREVIDHYDTHTEYSYSDNGDGTFTEHSHTVSDPVYRTEHYTETEQEPVYKDVPVYKTKYYYEIERWVYNRTEKSSGKNDSKVYWPEYHLAKNEKVSNRNEVYGVVFTTDKKDYKKKVTENELSSLTLDTKVKITVQAGIVTKFEILTN